MTQLRIVQELISANGHALKAVMEPGRFVVMITFTQGNLLDADVEALVNTVNTVGVMGKGIALMFKEAFPENFQDI